MNIKQKLTWAFAVIACLPILVVAAIVIVNLRDKATSDFADSSAREIRQVDNAMQLFFDGITQNVNYIAAHPLIAGASDDFRNYMGATPPRSPRMTGRRPSCSPVSPRLTQPTPTSLMV